MGVADPYFDTGTGEAMTPRGPEDDFRQAALEIAQDLIKVAAGKERTALLVAIGILLGQVEKTIGPMDRKAMFDVIGSAMNDQLRLH